MSNAMVTAEHLHKSYGSKRVLDDFSFAVAGGDVIGVLGKNGAGKTTLLEVMLGFTRATSGSVQAFGHDTFRLPGAAKARIGFVPQVDELLEQLTAREQLRVIGSFYANWDEAMLERLAKSWELDLDQRVRSMSTGQRQKLAILLALGHHPDLLILDEPVASLDPVARRQFLEEIIAIAADGRRAVVFSSHIVSDVERLANRIWILKAGRLYWHGDLDTLKESIVRIHFHANEPLPPGFTIANAFSQRADGTYVTAIVSDWTSARRQQIESHVNGALEIEQLALEEIFLELHR